MPHVWHVPAHGHDAAQWKQDLYHFARTVFREAGAAAGGDGRD